MRMKNEEWGDDDDENEIDRWLVWSYNNNNDVPFLKMEVLNEFILKKNLSSTESSYDALILKMEELHIECELTFCFFLGTKNK